MVRGGNFVHLWIQSEQRPRSSYVQIVLRRNLHDSESVSSRRYIHQSSFRGNLKQRVCLKMRFEDENEEMYKQAFSGESRSCWDWCWSGLCPHFRTRTWSICCCLLRQVSRPISTKPVFPQLCPVKMISLRSETLPPQMHSVVKCCINKFNQMFGSNSPAWKKILLRNFFVSPATSSEVWNQRLILFWGTSSNCTMSFPHRRIEVTSTKDYCRLRAQACSTTWDRSPTWLSIPVCWTRRLRKGEWRDSEHRCKCSKRRRLQGRRCCARCNRHLCWLCFWSDPPSPAKWLDLLIFCRVGIEAKVDVRMAFFRGVEIGDEEFVTSQICEVTIFDEDL